MQCEICASKAATIHLTEIINGQRSERHLCQGCAQAEGIAVENQLSLNELLSSLLAAGEQVDSPQDFDRPGCEDCGMTFDEFKSGGLLGCANDYEVFGDALESVIEKTQDGNTAHIGKVPEGFDAETQQVPRSDIRKLQLQLEVAVKNEDYELAAKLRDEIKKMQ